MTYYRHSLGYTPPDPPIKPTDPIGYVPSFEQPIDSTIAPIGPPDVTAAPLGSLWSTLRITSGDIELPAGAAATYYTIAPFDLITAQVRVDPQIAAAFLIEDIKAGARSQFSTVGNALSAELLADDNPVEIRAFAGDTISFAVRNRSGGSRPFGASLDVRPASESVMRGFGLNWPRGVLPIDSFVDVQAGETRPITVIAQDDFTLDGIRVAPSVAQAFVLSNFDYPRIVGTLPFVQSSWGVWVLSPQPSRWYSLAMPFLVIGEALQFNVTNRSGLPVRFLATGTGYRSRLL